MCLVGGFLFLEGWVEIYSSGFWGIVCDDFWDNIDVVVVCFMLGFLRLVLLNFNLFVISFKEDG